MKVVGICGHFGLGENLLNGQTVKTKIVTRELEKQFGEAQVQKLDTHGGIRQLPKILWESVKLFKNCGNIIVLPANNGLRVFVPLFSLLNHFYKRKLLYIVIGGWLPEFLNGRNLLTKQLKRFEGIYVETNSIKKLLENIGFENIIVMPNCKELTVLKESELVYPDGEPYKLCTFSRVMLEKGIEDAIESVKAVNEKLERMVYTLDIYGQVDSGYKERFEQLQKEFPDYIKYNGLVPFDKSVEVLKNYFALLFPTRFYTEGIPGTIIDAYAAGIPVISAKWESFSDIVEDRVTGIGYEFGNSEALFNTLLCILDLKDGMISLKRNCFEASLRFLPKVVLKVLVNNLGYK